MYFGTNELWALIGGAASLAVTLGFALLSDSVGLRFWKEADSKDEKIKTVGKFSSLRNKAISNK